MGYIREPEGIDFLVSPTVLTSEDDNAIKQAINSYKATGNYLNTCNNLPSDISILKKRMDAKSKSIKKAAI